MACVLVRALQEAATDAGQSNEVRTPSLLLASGGQAGRTGADDQDICSVALESHLA